MGLRWYLFGAQAAIIYGAARLTADVDVTVDLGERPTRDLAKSLARARFKPRFPLNDHFIGTTRVMPVIHGPSG
jgi:hypothetical protein